MKVVSIFVTGACCFVSQTFALEMIVKTPSDKVLLIDAASSDTIENIEDFIDHYEQCPEELRKEVFGKAVTEIDEVFPESGPVRNYLTPLTQKEKEDIAYIVNTLSDQPTPKLLFYKSSLNQAGDRINHVHPLNFMLVIFTDDLLKVKVRNIKRKGWVWKDFMAGIRNSMIEENAKNNIKPEFFFDFASKIGIDYSKIETPIAKANWDELVNVLMKHAESQGDNDRYKM